MKDSNRISFRHWGFALALLPATAGAALAQGARDVAPGTSWVVDTPTKLTRLVIGQGANITAPPGHSLTMTVNKVETDIAPGTYSGAIVLTPTDEAVVNFNDMGGHEINKLRAAIYIDNGAYVPAKSVSDAVIAGPGAVSDTQASGVKITSDGKEFNGIMITGNSKFAIRNAKITMTGNGRNDFDGFGAAIRVSGNSSVTIDHATIIDKGVVRTAIWVGDSAVVRVNNSDIDVNDGTLPADYSWSWMNPAKSKDVILETPWMIGTRGNARATLVVDQGTVIYNHSRIRAEAWGVLSTDDPKGEMNVAANDCDIETSKNGYGAYAVGDTLDNFSHSRFNVVDYGEILAGGSAVFTDGTVVNSHRFGVMSHGSATGFLTIEKGSVFNTEKAVIQLKSSSPDILVDDAGLNSKSGVILEAIVDDDPDNGGLGPTPAPGSKPSSPPPPPPSMQPGRYNAQHPTKDIDATFKDVTLKGDFINSLTPQSTLILHFTHARIIGAISTATAVHAVGPHGEKLVMQDSPDLYYLIGDVTETDAPTRDAHGVTVDLDGASNWTVTKPSYITDLTVAAGAKITAPAGYTLQMTVNGVQAKPAAGHYSGQIALTPVAPAANAAMGNGDISAELESLTEALGLSDAQQAQARQILADRQAQVLAVRAAFPAPRPGAAPPPGGPVKMRSVMNAAHARMLSILNAAQRTKYDRMDTSGNGPPPAG